VPVHAALAGPGQGRMALPGLNAREHDRQGERRT
jgi:hypothetical protein